MLYRCGLLQQGSGCLPQQGTVRVATILLVAPLLQGAVSHRSRPESSLEDLRTPEEGPPPLNILASTWNAYNRVWKKATDASAMLDAVSAGHEEADLVMIGFQEYMDKAEDGDYVAEMLQSKLWTTSINTQIQVLNELAERRPDTSVVEVKRLIVNKFDLFHGSATEKVKQLLGLVSNWDAASDINIVLEACKDLKSILESFKAEDYYEEFQVIWDWSEGMLAELRDWMHNVNLLTKEAESRFSKFFDAIHKVPRVAHESLEHRERQEALSTVKEILAHLLSPISPKDAKRIEDDGKHTFCEASLHKVKKHLKLWKRALTWWVEQVAMPNPVELRREDVLVPSIAQTFDSDAPDNERRGECYTFARHYDTDLRVFTNPWSRWQPIPDSVVQYNIDYNGKVPAFSTDGQCGKGVNVIRVKLRADSGKYQMNLCMINSHMSFKYSFVHRMYNLEDTFRSLSGDHRFNEQDLQCDALVFVADFNTRLLCYPVGAYTLTASNSSRSGGLVPVCDASDDERNSFASVMDTFCTHDKCSLQSDTSVASHFKAQADELTQLLSHPRLSCFEKVEKKKSSRMFGSKSPGGWKIFAEQDDEAEGVEDNLPENVLWNHGVSDKRLREAGIPNFAPTYKVASQQDFTGKGKKKEPMSDWSRCMPFDELCVANEYQDYKHNPAWTDRIIIRDSETAQMETKFYQRRTFSVKGCDKERKKEDGACSDHAVVTALLSVTPPSA